MVRFIVTEFRVHEGCSGEYVTRTFTGIFTATQLPKFIQSKIYEYAEAAGEPEIEKKFVKQLVSEVLAAGNMAWDPEYNPFFSKYLVIDGEEPKEHKGGRSLLNYEGLGLKQCLERMYKGEK